MEYTLMHKNIPVIDMGIDETGYYISKLHTLHDARRLPLGVPLLNAGVDRKALNDWWTERCIPVTRDGITDALQSIGISSPIHLLEKCYGLSLSDCYWICPKGSGLSWEEVNFFGNGFPKDMGDALFGHEPANPGRVSLMSPDNTTDGWLRKRWIILGGKRVLMKAGSGVMRQEPYNEVIACAVMRRLGISHVDYSITVDDGKPYSLCENFVTPDAELIPAWRVLQTRKQPNNRSLRDHFLDCCDMLGAPGVPAALNRMLALDYIIANEDRHWNNFGLVRNADTLEFLGLAPIYDSGTSLWYNTPRVGMRVGSKPFRKDHAEQIKLAGDLCWFDLGALAGLEEENVGILSSSAEVERPRREAIAKAVMEKAGQIEKLKSGVR